MKPSRPPAPALRAVVAVSRRETRLRIGELLRRDRSAEVAVAGSPEELAATLRQDQPDLLFVDRLGCSAVGSAGVPMLPPLIFVAAEEREALLGFELGAADCLLEPIAEERFRGALVRADAARALARRAGLQERLDRLASRLELEAGNRLFLKSSGEISVVRRSDVDWIEADGDYVKLHQAGRTHMVRATMTAFETRLDPGRFVRIHRSTIVNVDRIRKLRLSLATDHTVVLQDGTTLRLSRGYHGRLRDMIGNMEDPFGDPAAPMPVRTRRHGEPAAAPALPGVARP
jgi:two-component system, LytTR family, response regulator